MWETLTVESEPVTLEEAKRHLRLNPGNEEDEYVYSLITAVREFSENYIGRSIAKQKIRCVEDDTKAIVLPRPPVASIVSARVDGDDVDYDFDPINMTVTLSEKAERVEIIYNAGSAVCPGGLKLAMLILIGNWYENREAVVTGAVTSVIQPLSAMTLLNQYKAWWF